MGFATGCLAFLAHRVCYSLLNLDALLLARELDALLPAQGLDALLPAPAERAETSDDMGAEPEDQEPAPMAGAAALELELLEEVPAGDVVAGAAVVFSNSEL